LRHRPTPCTPLSIEIHQIYYDPSQRSRLDPAFTPWYNPPGPASDWCEYGVMRAALRTRGKLDDLADGHAGFVSWKFGRKTGLTGERFLYEIQANPGYDCYIVNPFTQLMHQYQNVWYHGDRWHPGLIDFTREVFREVGYDIEIRDLVHGTRLTAFCNYFVANRRFWERYLTFCEPVYDFVENHLSQSGRDRLEASRSHTFGLSYRPYIMERMLSTLLWSNAAGAGDLTWHHIDPMRDHSLDELLVIADLDRAKDALASCPPEDREVAFRSFNQLIRVIGDLEIRRQRESRKPIGIRASMIQFIRSAKARWLEFFGASKTG